VDRAGSFLVEEHPDATGVAGDSLEEALPRLRGVRRGGPCLRGQVALTEVVVASASGGSVARSVAWFTLGVWSALVIYYMLYRVSLPLKPFIYQAF